MGGRKPSNMTCRKSAVLAMLLGITGVVYPQGAALAEEPSAQFLSSSTLAQENYIKISVVMAMFVASTDSKSKAECVKDWYFNHKAARNHEIADKVRKYPDYHPTSVILESPIGDQ